MSGSIAVLAAIGRATWRNLQSLSSIAGNNFFYFLLLVALQPDSAAFFVLILGLLMLFPLSASPFEKVPRDRWALWPLSAAQRFAIRAGCLALSPITWITVALLVRAGRQSGLWFLVAAILARLVVAAGSLLRKRLPAFDLVRRIPVPPGPVGQIFRLHLREMLGTIDPYVALLLALATITYRLSYRVPDPSAFRVMALVIAIALSTSAQVLFGLDGTGFTRFRLMPVRGWTLLIGKDLAFITILLALAAPLDLVGGATAGLVALAIGHHVSVFTPIPQTKWRFASGAVTVGLLQMAGMASAAAGTWQAGARVFAGCAFAYTISVFWYGRQWDRLKA